MTGQPSASSLALRVYGVLLAVVTGIGLAVSLMHWWAS